MKKNNITGVDGILLDLGLSSMQLDLEDRGFSFQKNSSVDMRFDQTEGETASELINRLNQEELANIIYEFGEERRSRIIAQSIKKSSIIFNNNSRIRSSIHEKVLESTYNLCRIGYIKLLYIPKQ